MLQDTKIKKSAAIRFFSSIFALPFGRIAQLVQSICLTSRGSAVRTRVRPHQIPQGVHHRAPFFVDVFVDGSLHVWL